MLPDAKSEREKSFSSISPIFSSSKWFSWELVCYSLLPFPHNIYFIPSQTQKNCRKWHILGNVLKVATYIHWRPGRFVLNNKTLLCERVCLFCQNKLLFYKYNCTFFYKKFIFYEKNKPFKPRSRSNLARFTTLLTLWSIYLV